MIAIFPARANPPHIGHIRAFLKIREDYEKIIITISNNTYKGTKKNIMPPEDVIEILKEIFNHIPGYEIIPITEPFITRTSFDDLPDFDIVVTGNTIIYENMKKQNIPVRLMQRTPVYRGEFIREALEEALQNAYERGETHDKKHST